MSTDITPQYPLVSSNEKLQYVASTSDLAQASGGGTTNANNTTVGQGNQVYKVTSQGIQLGAADFASAPFSVDMSGNLIATSATITGGIIKYNKTSFTDSAHAGYWIGPASLYFGSVSDASYLKYDIANATLNMTGTITSSTIIGGLVETSNTTTRVELNGSANELRVYQAGNLVASLGAFDGADGQMFMINYSTTDAFSPVFIRGKVPNTSMAWFANDGNNRAMTISADTNVASGALYVRNGTASAIGTGTAAAFESNSTSSTLPTIFIKNSGASGIALRVKGKIYPDNNPTNIGDGYNIGDSGQRFDTVYSLAISASKEIVCDTAGGFKYSNGELLAYGGGSVSTTTIGGTLFNTVTLKINGTSRTLLMV